MLTPEQTIALDALLTSATQKDAAALAGVTEKTMCAWVRLPEFKQALEDASLDLVKHSLRRLKSLSNKAVDRLGKAIDEAKTDKDRIAASDKVLAHLTRFADLLDLQEQVEQLQARVDTLNPAKADDTPHEAASNV